MFCGEAMTDSNRHAAKIATLHTHSKHHSFFKLDENGLELYFCVTLRFYSEGKLNNIPDHGGNCRA